MSKNYLIFKIISNLVNIVTNYFFPEVCTKFWFKKV